MCAWQLSYINNFKGKTKDDQMLRKAKRIKEVHNEVIE